MNLHNMKSADDTQIEIEHNGQTVKTTGKALRSAAMNLKQLRMDGEGFGPIRTNFEQARLDEKFRGHAKQIIKSVEMKELAEQVIEQRGLDIGPASVACLTVWPNISSKRAGKITKCNDVLRHFSGYDYIITVSGELWDMLDDDSRKMMLYHYLMQVAPEFKAKDQSWTMKLRKPDFADFYSINDRHGNEWYKVIQATVSSLYDLDPVSESQVRV